MHTSQPIIIRSLEDLFDALRSRKNALGLSNETVDVLAGVTRGHCDKTLGPARTRKLTSLTFDLFLDVLAVELRMVVNLDAAKRMEARWEGRLGNYRAKDYHHVPNRIGAKVLESAKPLIVRENGRIGGNKAAAMLSPEQRKVKAANAAKTRWRAVRRRKRQAKQRAADADVPPIAICTTP